MFGRWKKIDPGYGRAVLGYFGRTPLPPDPEVVKIAAAELNLPVFDGDPLEAAPKNIEVARRALEERKLPVTDRNIFLVLASMVPGKNMETNEGIRLLAGNFKVDIPLKKQEKKAETPPTPVASPPPAAPALSGPVTTRCTVDERGNLRTFLVTIEPMAGAHKNAGPGAVTETLTAPAGTDGVAVYSPFDGLVAIADILVRVGEVVRAGQVVAAVEAMKAKHDVKAPCNGVVASIRGFVGEEIEAKREILTIAPRR
jgi:pyruvate carboxylase subunit B